MGCGAKVVAMNLAWGPSFLCASAAIAHGLTTGNRMLNERQIQLSIPPPDHVQDEVAPAKRQKQRVISSDSEGPEHPGAIRLVCCFLVKQFPLRVHCHLPGWPLAPAFAFGFQLAEGGSLEMAAP